MTFYRQYCPGQSPTGVYQNLTSRIDRRACGGWYVSVHLGAWRFTWYGRNR